MASSRHLGAREKRTRLGVVASLVTLLLLACGGSDRRELAESRAEELREKPWQTWSEEDLQWGLGHYDEVYEARRVASSGAIRNLEPGPPIRELADGSAGGEQVERYLSDQRIAGLLVIQHGRVRLERYALGHSEQDRWTSQSVAKSITSTLVGIALRRGAIKSLDDPVTQYIHGLQGSAYDDVTVRQLLTMTSGVRWVEDYTDLSSDLPRLYATAPAAGLSVASTYMGSLPREDAPGERWVYKTGETHLLGDLVRAATGATLSDYLSDRIWKPYGMESDATWVLDASGAELAGCCLQATLRDYGRFGLFVLGQGLIGDSAVVPDGWFREATAPQVAIDGAESGYGFQWWTHPNGTFSAFGIYGQTIHIDWARDLIIVLNAAWPEALSTARSAARWAFFDLVVSAIDEEEARLGGG